MKTIKTGVNFLGIQFGFNRTLPEELKDLNQKQYIAIIRYMTGQITEKKLIATVLNIPYLLTCLLFNSYSQYKLIEALEQVVNLKMSCDRFLINKIEKTNLVCHSEQLKGISFMRFMYIDTQYTMYMQRLNSEYLYKFIAGLFIGRKEKFEDVEMSKRVIYVQNHVDSIFTEAVLVNYLMIKKWLSIVYPYMFPDSETEESGVTSKKQQQNWINIFDALVGENIPDTPYYKNMPCMDAFRIINNRIKDYKHAN